MGVAKQTAELPLGLAFPTFEMDRAHPTVMAPQEANGVMQMPYFSHPHS
jgi:hypothetical protein